MDFAEEGEAEAMLAVAPEERGKNHSFDQIIEVVKKEHKEGNRYTKKQEYRMAAKCFEPRSGVGRLVGQTWRLMLSCKLQPALSSA